MNSVSSEEYIGMWFSFAAPVFHKNCCSNTTLPMEMYEMNESGLSKHESKLLQKIHTTCIKGTTWKAFPALA